MRLVVVAGVITLVGGALAQLVSSIVWPVLPGQPTDATLETMRQHLPAARLGLWVDLGILLLIPAGLFVGKALGSQTRTAVAVGTGLLFLGCLLQVPPLAGDVVLVQAAEANDIAAVDGFFGSAPMTISLFGGLLLQLAGLVVLGIQVIRRRVASVWIGALLIAWPILQFLGTATAVKPLVTGAYVLQLLAYAGCAGSLATRRTQP
ncbi:hypothetical protein OG474_41075 [Kribbella sp. NBC_01505]|uniref:hypothetical protein n=1 Tax=Kribbella sp. NBC_01505 TaxID=2903580 RepID=UPI003869AAC3